MNKVFAVCYEDYTPFKLFLTFKEAAEYIAECEKTSDFFINYKIVEYFSHV